MSGSLSGSGKNTSFPHVLHNEDVFLILSSLPWSCGCFWSLFKDKTLGLRGGGKWNGGLGLDSAAGGLPHQWDRHCKRGWGHSRDRLLRGTSATFSLPSGRSSTRSEDQSRCKQSSVQAGSSGKWQDRPAPAVGTGSSLEQLFEGRSL